MNPRRALMAATVLAASTVCPASPAAAAGREPGVVRVMEQPSRADAPRTAPRGSALRVVKARAARAREAIPGRIGHGRISVAHARPVTRPRDGLNFTALAACESSGDPQARNGKYTGLYQFDVPTWQSVGGSGEPGQASAAEQTLRARLLYAARGRAPWPECGRLL